MRWRWTRCPPEDRLAELHAVADAAQRVAGVLAARQRGDVNDAADLLGSFDDTEGLASGAMLLAPLSIGMCAQSADQSFEESARDLCLQMEASRPRTRGPS